MTFKKKSVTADAVVGLAASNLKKSVFELKTGLASLETLTGKVEELDLQIVSKEQKIEELNTIYNEKLRQQSVDLGLKAKEDALKLVQETLALNKLVTISEDELKELKEDLIELQVSLDERVKKEVNSVTGSLHGSFANKEKLLEAEYKAKEAQNMATITAQGNTINQLNGQIESWKKQLDDERKASVDRAKASAVGSINVGAGETGRR